MYQKERLDEIVNILNTHGYVTVKFLTEKLCYSVATVNRDLNVLEKQKLVHRTYGGVELVKKRGVALPFRYHKMKSAKAKIGRRAAELVHDGDTVFLDASTTTEYISRYLVEKKDITVITNNIAIVHFLSEAGVRTVCLGGEIVEPPSMLSGNATVEAAMKYNADIMFFSTGGFSSDGIIAGGITYDLVHKAMANNSKRFYYVADHDKLNSDFRINLFTLDEIDGIITDYTFEQEIKNRYKNCEFVEVL